MILQSLQPQPHEREREHDVGFAIKQQGAAKTYVLQIRLPRVLLAELDDPKRVIIIGSPHEGYIFTPTKDRNLGVGIPYKSHTAGQFIFLSTAFKPTKLTKVVRKMTLARARVVDGKIRTGGMPPEWISGTAAFAGDSKAPSAPAHHRLAASTTSGSIKMSGNGQDHGNGHDSSPTVPPPRRDVPKIADSVTVEQIGARLDVALREAMGLKLALERRTGLHFRVSQDFRLILDTSNEPTKS